MALTSKKYTRIYSSDGNDSDKIDSDKIAKLESDFNSNSYLKAYGQFDMLAPVLHILQKLTEEIDYLRTEIELNKDKTGITNSQASAITANTAKTGITSGEQRDIANNKTNVANNVTEITKLTKGKLSVSAMPAVQAGVEQGVECAVVYDSKTKTYSMVFAYLETTTPKGGKATTVARTGSIQLK
jgi:hypothetical protein|tara:strand:- start:350 stop:904 length:555 start_codon:yes stop_codon:yes gene_type:complete